MQLLKSDFYYDLPEDLIAQTPIEPRNASRMMCIDRNTGNITHDHFYNLCSRMKKGDLLVMNDSRVIPARIWGEKVREGSFASDPSKIEMLLLKQLGDDKYEVLLRPAKKIKIGGKINAVPAQCVQHLLCSV